MNLSLDEIINQLSQTIGVILLKLI